MATPGKPSSGTWSGVVSTLVLSGILTSVAIVIIVATSSFLPEHYLPRLFFVNRVFPPLEKGSGRTVASRNPRFNATAPRSLLTIAIFPFVLLYERWIRFYRGREEHPASAAAFPLLASSSSLAEHVSVDALITDLFIHLCLVFFMGCLVLALPIAIVNATSNVEPSDPLYRFASNRLPHGSPKLCAVFVGLAGATLLLLGLFHFYGYPHYQRWRLRWQTVLAPSSYSVMLLGLPGRCPPVHQELHTGDAAAFADEQHHHGHHHEQRHGAPTRLPAKHEASRVKTALTVRFLMPRWSRGDPAAPARKADDTVGLLIAHRRRDGRLEGFAGALKGAVEEWETVQLARLKTRLRGRNPTQEEYGRLHILEEKRRRQGKRRRSSKRDDRGRFLSALRTMGSLRGLVGGHGDHQHQDASASGPPTLNPRPSLAGQSLRPISSPAPLEVIVESDAETSNTGAVTNRTSTEATGAQVPIPPYLSTNKEGEVEEDVDGVQCDMVDETVVKRLLGMVEQMAGDTDAEREGEEGGADKSEAQIAAAADQEVAGHGSPESVDAYPGKQPSLPAPPSAAAVGASASDAHEAHAGPPIVHAPVQREDVVDETERVFTVDEALKKLEARIRARYIKLSFIREHYDVYGVQDSVFSMTAAAVDGSKGRGEGSKERKNKQRPRRSSAVATVPELDAAATSAHPPPIEADVVPVALCPAPIHPFASASSTSSSSSASVLASTVVASGTGTDEDANSSRHDDSSSGSSYSSAAIVLPRHTVTSSYLDMIDAYTSTTRDASGARRSSVAGAAAATAATLGDAKEAVVQSATNVLASPLARQLLSVSARFLHIHQEEQPAAGETSPVATHKQSEPVEPMSAAAHPDILEAPSLPPESAHDVKPAVANIQAREAPADATDAVSQQSEDVPEPRVPDDDDRSLSLEEIARAVAQRRREKMAMQQGLTDTDDEAEGTSDQSGIPAYLPARSFSPQPRSSTSSAFNPAAAAAPGDIVIAVQVVPSTGVKSDGPVSPPHSLRRELTMRTATRTTSRRISLTRNRRASSAAASVGAVSPSELSPTIRASATTTFYGHGGHAGDDGRDAERLRFPLGRHLTPANPKLWVARRSSPRFLKYDLQTLASRLTVASVPNDITRKRVAYGMGKDAVLMPDLPTELTEAEAFKTGILPKGFNLRMPAADTAFVTFMDAGDAQQVLQQGKAGFAAPVRRDRNKEDSSTGGLSAPVRAILRAYGLPERGLNPASIGFANLQVLRAPDPSAVIWSNTTLTAHDRWWRPVVSSLILTLVIIIASLPSFVAATLANLVPLEGAFDFLGPVLDFANISRGILTTLLPALIVNVIVMLLRVLVTALSKLRGLVDYLEVDLFTSRWWFVASFIAAVVSYTIASTFLGSAGGIVKDPSAILRLLATSLPEQSSTFISYILLAALQGWSFELLRPFELWIWGCVWRPRNITNRRYRRHLRKRHGRAPAYKYVPSVALVLCMAMLYAFVNPIILVPAIGYTLIAAAVTGHQSMYLYHKPFEGGGIFFKQAVDFATAGLLFTQLIHTFYFFIQGVDFAAYLTIALLCVTLGVRAYWLLSFDRPLAHLPSRVASTLQAEAMRAALLEAIDCGDQEAITMAREIMAKADASATRGTTAAPKPPEASPSNAEPLLGTIAPEVETSPPKAGQEEAVEELRRFIMTFEPVPQALSPAALDRYLEEYSETGSNHPNYQRLHLPFCHFTPAYRSEVQAIIAAIRERKHCDFSSWYFPDPSLPSPYIAQSWKPTSDIVPNGSDYAGDSACYPASRMRAWCRPEATASIPISSHTYPPYVSGSGTVPLSGLQAIPLRAHEGVICYPVEGGKMGETDQPPAKGAAADAGAADELLHAEVGADSTRKLIHRADGIVITAATTDVETANAWCFSEVERKVWRS